MSTYTTYLPSTQIHSFILWYYPFILTSCTCVFIIHTTTSKVTNVLSLFRFVRKLESNMPESLLPTQTPQLQIISSHDMTLKAFCQNANTRMPFNENAHNNKLHQDTHTHTTSCTRILSGDWTFGVTAHYFGFITDLSTNTRSAAPTINIVVVLPRLRCYVCVAMFVLPRLCCSTFTIATTRYVLL